MVELGLILAISVLGLAFAGYLIKWVMARDTGTPAMREVSDAIKARTAAVNEPAPVPVEPQVQPES